MSSSDTPTPSSSSSDSAEQPLSPDATPSTNLSRILPRVYRIYYKVQEGSADEIEIRQALSLLKTADSLALALGVYENKRETLDLNELSSKDVRLLSIPFLTGYLLQQTKYEKSTRAGILQAARAQLLRFLRILNSFSLFDNAPVLQKSYQAMIENKAQTPMETRDTLVERMKYERSLRVKIDELLKRNEAKLDDEFDLSFSDESDFRQLGVSQLLHFATLTFRELSSIERELPMLEYMLKMEEQGKDPRVESERRMAAEARQKTEGGGGMKNFTVLRDGSVVPIDLSGARSSSSSSASPSLSQLYQRSGVKAELYSGQSASQLAAGSGVAGSGAGVVALYESDRKKEIQKQALTGKQTWTISLEEEMQAEADRQQARLKREKEYEEAEKNRPKPKVDSDEADEVERREKMDWDEWHDDHPYGSGNRG